MIELRKSSERGHFHHGWLDTYHTFSFADYYDPQWMGYRSLRVINEDRVDPGEGFAPHSHRDMEIVTFILEGSLEHKDSMGNTSIIRPGEAQRMTAGTGVTHSEYNPSKSQAVHLLQIWILPAQKGLVPGYEQRAFDLKAPGRLTLLASPDGAEGSVTVHQDALLYHGQAAGKPIVYNLKPGRGAWVQVYRGNVTANGRTLEAGDSAALENETTLEFSGTGEFLLFDLK